MFSTITYLPREKDTAPPDHYVLPKRQVFKRPKLSGGTTKVISESELARFKKYLGADPATLSVDQINEVVELYKEMNKNNSGVGSSMPDYTVKRTPSVPTYSFNNNNRRPKIKLGGDMMNLPPPEDHDFEEDGETYNEKPTHINFSLPTVKRPARRLPLAPTGLFTREEGGKKFLPAFNLAREGNEKITLMSNAPAEKLMHEGPAGFPYIGEANAYEDADWDERMEEEEEFNTLEAENAEIYDEMMAAELEDTEDKPRLTALAAERKFEDARLENEEKERLREFKEMEDEDKAEEENFKLEREKEEKEEADAKRRRILENRLIEKYMNVEDEISRNEFNLKDLPTVIRNNHLGKVVGKPIPVGEKVMIYVYDKDGKYIAQRESISLRGWRILTPQQSKRGQRRIHMAVPIMTPTLLADKSMDDKRAKSELMAKAAKEEKKEKKESKDSVIKDTSGLDKKHGNPDESDVIIPDFTPEEMTEMYVTDGFGNDEPIMSTTTAVEPKKGMIDRFITTPVKAAFNAGKRLFSTPGHKKPGDEEKKSEVREARTPRGTGTGTTSIGRKRAKRLAEFNEKKRMEAAAASTASTTTPATATKVATTTTTAPVTAPVTTTTAPVTTTTAAPVIPIMSPDDPVLTSFNASIDKLQSDLKQPEKEKDQAEKELKQPETELETVEIKEITPVLSTDIPNLVELDTKEIFNAFGSVVSKQNVKVEDYPGPLGIIYFNADTGEIEFREKATKNQRSKFTGKKIGEAVVHRGFGAESLRDERPIMLVPPSLLNNIGDLIDTANKLTDERDENNANRLLLLGTPNVKHLPVPQTTPTTPITTPAKETTPTTTPAKEKTASTRKKPISVLSVKKNSDDKKKDNK